MNKMLPAITCALLSWNRSGAQQTGEVALSVTTSELVVMNINVPAVAFDVSGMGMYGADQTKSQAAQLTIMSSKPFDLEVKAGTDAMHNGSYTLPLAMLQIQCTNKDLGVTPSDAVTLSTTRQKLLDEGAAVTGALINIKYTLRTHSRFSDFRTAPAGVYITNLIYTAAID